MKSGFETSCLICDRSLYQNNLQHKLINSKQYTTLLFHTENIEYNQKIELKWNTLNFNHTLIIRPVDVYKTHMHLIVDCKPIQSQQNECKAKTFITTQCNPTIMIIR